MCDQTCVSPQTGQTKVSAQNRSAAKLTASVLMSVDISRPVFGHTIQTMPIATAPPLRRPSTYACQNPPRRPSGGVQRDAGCRPAAESAVVSRAISDDALAAERFRRDGKISRAERQPPQSGGSCRAEAVYEKGVVDEAQDLAPAELRFFAALAPAKADGLFLAGDVGQRIFQHPFSWASLGVDVRGRSHTLKVCYRTSQQIRRAADKLLPAVLRDTDGLEDERRGIISVFDGPPPEVKSLDTIAAEADAVREIVKTWLGDGIAPHEIGMFVRTPQFVTRARSAIAGLNGEAEMTTAPMSLAKGLEFRAVVVMACDEGVLPRARRRCCR